HPLEMTGARTARGPTRSHTPEADPAGTSRAPRWTVFISCAPGDITLAIAAKEEIERLGATVIVHEGVIFQEPGNESQLLDALLKADEVLSIPGSFGREFLDRRYPWIALGAATARELPMFLLPADRGGAKRAQSPEIPTVFRKMDRPRDLKTYLR